MSAPNVRFMGILMLGAAMLLYLSFTRQVHSATPSSDPCGPIAYPGMKVVVDQPGVQAPGYQFQNNSKKPSPWQAKWIWVANQTASSSTAGSFHATPWTRGTI